MSLLIVTPEHPVPLEFSASLVRSYPLDSILVVPPADRQLHLLGDALAVIQQAPYLPLVVGTGTESSGPLKLALGEHVVEAIAYHFGADPTTEAVRIRAAIRARDCPSKARLVGMVAHSIGGGISTPLAKALTGARLTRAEQARLVATTGLRPTAWPAVYCCLELVTDAWSKERSVESLARDHGISPKTIWVRCQRLFGMTWSEACRWHSWEGLVEWGIRKARAGGMTA